MTVGKFAIATVLLLVTFAGCEWYGTKLPPTHLAYAVFVNFIFLAVATALTTALELPLLPQSYFAPKQLEGNGRIYRWTGLVAFVSVLRLIGWERLWRKQTPIRSDLDALRAYADGTRGAEAIHVVAGVCTLGLTLSIALRYTLIATKWLWLVNVLVNLYPVMLQRYNRPRVDRLILRLERATNAESTEPSDPPESSS